MVVRCFELLAQVRSARAQAHQDMDVLKSNLRQEHWEVLNWITKCYEVTTPVQTARFMLGSHPRWCAAP